MVVVVVVVVHNLVAMWLLSVLSPLPHLGNNDRALCISRCKRNRTRIYTVYIWFWPTLTI